MTYALIATAGVAAILGISVALSQQSSAPSHVAYDIPLETGDARATAPRNTTMRILPAPVIDPSAGVFIGTGDGGNGFWVPTSR